MEKSKKVLGIILARGGSKSILKKSIALCAGKPLMAYTIEAARNAKGIDRLIISTDDEEMAEYAKSQGVEVPFLRPAELAQDLTPDLPVMQHALEWLKTEEGFEPEMVVHLRPTTPLKASADISRGIHLLRSDAGADSVRSVCRPPHTPFKMFRLGEDNPYLVPILKKEYPEIFEKYSEPYNMPRQVLPEIWRHSGYLDIIRTEVICDKNSMSGTHILPLPFEEWRDIDIDTADDLLRAEIVINRLSSENRNTWQT